MKVAIYCRVSTEEQDAMKQELELREFCANRNYQIFGVYSDVISGSKDSRPMLNVMMQDAYKHNFDAVVIWKLDRLGRSLSHLLDIANKFNLWKIHLICKTQDFDTSTPSGKLMFSMFGMIAEFERELIRERTKLGMKKAKNVGKRGKDKGVRKKSGYILRWALKKQKQDKEDGVNNSIHEYLNKRG